MDEINILAEQIHGISTSKGFKPPTLENLPEKLMLSVSELAEALEEHRSGRPLVWYEGNKPEGILVEIADSIIRNLHMMHSLIEQSGDPDLRVDDIIHMKVGYNAGRPAMHGRNY